MSERRVMHLITRFVGGGAESMTEDALCALRESEFEAELYLGHGNEYDEELVSEINKMGVETKSFQYMRHYNPAALLISVVSLVIFLKRNNIDTIHTHSTEAGIVGRIAGKIVGTPTIIHSVHGVYFSGDNNHVLNKVVELLERLCSSWTDELIADCKSTRNAFVKRGIGTKDQFRIIPPVIPISEFQSGEQLERNSFFTFLFVGRLESNKGVLDLIEAFGTLPDDDIELLIVGEGDLEDEVKHKIDELGIQDEVQALGYRDDIPRIMSCANAFVLPTYREGFSITVTEALAAGLPVISTPVGEIPRKVDHGQNGYLVEPGNIIELAEKMKQVRRGSLESGGNHNNLQRYSKKQVYHQYIHLYTDI